MASSSPPSSSPPRIPVRTFIVSPPSQDVLVHGKPYRSKHNGRPSVLGIDGLVSSTLVFTAVDTRQDLHTLTSFRFRHLDFIVERTAGRAAGSVSTASTAACDPAARPHPAAQPRLLLGVDRVIRSALEFASSDACHDLHRLTSLQTLRDDASRSYGSSSSPTLLRLIPRGVPLELSVVGDYEVGRHGCVVRRERPQATRCSPRRVDENYGSMRSGNPGSSSPALTPVTIFIVPPPFSSFKRAASSYEAS